MTCSKLDKYNYILILNKIMCVPSWKHLFWDKGSWLSEKQTCCSFANQAPQLVSHECVTVQPSPWGSQKDCDSPQPRTGYLWRWAAFSACLVWHTNIIIFYTSHYVKRLENIAICNQKIIWVTDSNLLIKCYYKQKKILWSLPMTIRLFVDRVQLICAYQWNSLLPGNYGLRIENNFNKLRWMTI